MLHALQTGTHRIAHDNGFIGATKTAEKEFLMPAWHQTKLLCYTPGSVGA